MRKHILKSVIGLLLLLTIQMVSAQSGIRVVVVNEFQNIRVAPALGAEVITTVDAGFVFENIDARSGDNQWLRIQHECNEGWINLAQQENQKLCQTPSNWNQKLNRSDRFQMHQ